MSGSSSYRSELSAYIRNMPIIQQAVYLSPHLLTALQAAKARNSEAELKALGQFVSELVALPDTEPQKLDSLMWLLDYLDPIEAGPFERIYPVSDFVIRAKVNLQALKTARLNFGEDSPQAQVLYRLFLRYAGPDYADICRESFDINVLDAFPVPSCLTELAAEKARLKDHLFVLINVYQAMILEVEKDLKPAKIVKVDDAIGNIVAEIEKREGLLHSSGDVDWYRHVVNIKDSEGSDTAVRLVKSMDSYVPLSEDDIDIPARTPSSIFNCHTSSAEEILAMDLDARLAKYAALKIRIRALQNLKPILNVKLEVLDRLTQKHNLIDGLLKQAQLLKPDPAVLSRVVGDLSGQPEFAGKELGFIEAYLLSIDKNGITAKAEHDSCMATLRTLRVAESMVPWIVDSVVDLLGADPANGDVEKLKQAFGRATELYTDAQVIPAFNYRSPDAPEEASVAPAPLPPATSSRVSRFKSLARERLQQRAALEGRGLVSFRGGDGGVPSRTPVRSSPLGAEPAPAFPPLTPEQERFRLEAGLSEKQMRVQLSSASSGLGSSPEGGSGSRSARSAGAGAGGFVAPPFSVGPRETNAEFWESVHREAYSGAALNPRGNSSAGASQAAVVFQEGGESDSGDSFISEP